MLPNRHLSNMTSEEIGRKVTSASVVVLPIGSLEQHGPHLPIGTDTVLASAISAAIVETLGETYDLWLLPAVPVSVSTEHEWSPGTFSVRGARFRSFVLDLCVGIARSTGAKRLLVINAHGGNRAHLESLIYDIERVSGVTCTITHPLSVIDAPASDLHAGVVETSMMLAVSPEAVREFGLSKQDKATSRSAAVASVVRNRSAAWAWRSNEPALSVEGIIGNPADASAELGVHWLGVIVEKYAAILELLLERS